MWVLGKIRESMESIPLELSRYMGKSEEDICLSSKAGLSHNLHNNILTPDKIPEFFLPPRLCKSTLMLEAETKATLHTQIPKSSTASNTTHIKTKDIKTKNDDAPDKEAWTKKPLPFSAEAYGLAGVYESPNTRRKESLFLSKCPVYKFDRSNLSGPRKLAKETKLPKKNASGLIPLLLCKSLSETGSTESETPSSSDSSPLSSPYSAKSSLCITSGLGRLKGATSCPSLTDIRRDRGIRRKRGVLSLTTSPSSPPSVFPLDVLQGQERHQREHVLSLKGRGKVHLCAELTTFSTNASSSLSTVRVRVMSVEGIYEDTDRRALNCAVNLCLTPGMLQQQESATIRNCRSPVFNEDFYFTELSREDLVELQLRLKVVDKPAAATLRRGIMIAVITKPLSQLLPLKNV
uniref:C2 calcium-dependent domain-containing protein 4C n=1 Tax=Semicossyphus pulcher TaxID=241346 RepID=UPI0037E7E158